jgi:hypothetical protein
MHEAHPFFDSEIPTIADQLSKTHRTHLVSVNNFLFTGLDAGFDKTENFTNSYMLFEGATDPREYIRQHKHDAMLTKYVSFLTTGGKPVRSLLNGLNYKFQKIRGQKYLEDIPKKFGDDTENYQYAETINNRIRSAQRKEDQPLFIVANYMDVHPPLEPSEAAVQAVAPGIDKDSLPIGKPTERIISNAEKSYDVEAMETLYKAAVWDLDRKVTPLVQELVDDGVFVIVTADHGMTFQTTPYEEVRRHVPLVLFHPETEGCEIQRTVDLRDLPRTTMMAVGTEPDDGMPTLLDNGKDEVAITEIIYHKTGPDGVSLQLNHDGTVPNDIHHDVVLRRGNTEVVLKDGKSYSVDSDDNANELIQIGKGLQEKNLSSMETLDSEYDEVTKKRLKELGYM